MGNSTALSAPAACGQPKRLIKAGLLTLPMILLTGLMTNQGRLPASTPALLAWLLSFAFLNILFFLMVYTGKTNKYRSLLF